MTVGRRIKEIRIFRNLTQKELADGMGVTRQWINRVERDKVTLGVHSVRKFSKYFNINPEILSCLLVVKNKEE